MENEKENYFKVLEQYVNRKAYYSYPVKGSSKKVRTLGISGVIKRHGYYYSIRDRSGKLKRIVPGKEGHLNVAGKTYDLSKLII